jgi:phytoene dehydrogenase-like protein
MESKFTQPRKNVIIIGGGLAGLTAAALLAKAGRSVTLLERASYPGGRAITIERQGFLFNMGVHAFYQTGSGEAVLKELGVSYQGRFNGRSQYEAQYKGQVERLPTDADTIRTTGMLDDEARSELGKLLMTLRNGDYRRWQGLSLHDWLEEATTKPAVRSFIEAVARLATYTDAPDLLDAGFALHLIGTQPGALLIDNGWQTLVNGLVQVAQEVGVELVMGARVVEVATGEDEHRVHLADGRFLDARAVILATEPEVAARLVGDGQHKELRRWADQAVPVYAACLDVGLRQLPDPRRVVVLDLDRPRFYSVHSRSSRLVLGEEGALLHIIKYLRPGLKEDARANQNELESWLDQLQPGWRTEVVARQFLPHIQVVGDMLQAQRGGLAGRPGPVVPQTRNLYVIGDWVGQEDYLANASFASARRAVQIIMEQE